MWLRQLNWRNHIFQIFSELLRHNHRGVIGVIDVIDSVIDVILNPSLIDINIFKIVLININIFENGLIDIDIFKNDLIDIDGFKKCRYIDNQYFLSIYWTPLSLSNVHHF